jgi:hypothetical protein
LRIVGAAASLTNATLIFAGDTHERMLELLAEISWEFIKEPLALTLCRTLNSITTTALITIRNIYPRVRRPF